MISKYPLIKAIINVGIGRLSQTGDFEKKVLPEVENAIAQITGQKAQRRPAKKSIAGFKLRQGQIVGLKVTLRRNRMMQFIDRLNNIVLPRIRDFKGIKLSAVDTRGNLTFGIKEHIVFPEIVLEDTQVNFGLEISLIPREPMSKEEGTEFYRKLGFPLQKEESTK